MEFGLEKSQVLNHTIAIQKQHVPLFNHVHHTNHTNHSSDIQQGNPGIRGLCVRCCERWIL